MIQNNQERDFMAQEINKQMTQFIHNPNTSNEADLIILLDEYRAGLNNPFCSSECSDEHEWAMNYIS